MACQNAPPAAAVRQTCQDCHAVVLDARHTLNCRACHGGASPAASAKQAHQGMIAKPAAPDHFRASCGGCHGKEVNGVRQSVHLTLAGYEKFRARYAGKAVTGIDGIPVYEQPQTPDQLADDLLRRRCLRCHLFYAGEGYPATGHGLGCAACHMRWQDGKMAVHQFIAVPGDKECLACHYGNRVGADYYGFFEHDLPPDYRTPFMSAANPSNPPFGIESHRLIADIHQRRGLVCIDCHRGGELMATTAEKASCAACHNPARLASRLPAGVAKKADGFIFTATNGVEYRLPTLRHKAHQRYGETVACQVCHAQWAFADEGSHFIRIDHDDLQEWRPLRRQGVAEVERLLENALSSEKDSGPPMMSDPFTGAKRPGVWLVAYGQRRWETIRLKRVGEKLMVARPLTDMFLSWVDADGRTRFDNIKPAGDDNNFIPYTPHTTGAAGIFWQDRLRDFQVQGKNNR